MVGYLVIRYQDIYLVLFIVFSGIYRSRSALFLSKLLLVVEAEVYSRNYRGKEK